MRKYYEETMYRRIGYKHRSCDHERYEQRYRSQESEAWIRVRSEVIFLLHDRLHLRIG